MNLSIKNVPDELAALLRERAARNHRSLQGELMAIVEAAARERPGTMTIAELRQEVRRLGVSTPSESAAIIREDRDGR
ncbi:Arc family DNA-binding protein [Azospirillum sp. RWY-5-1]|uniref:Arc family DNA-binding protein n=1 Tax=Azospirillum oleiclasticum TaxID=2735135 RepID=A0ABX2TJD9_9PROT|nr:Arc family DNA-binding protein [Azospirillum oleiclasticum]NYZ24464.1 Arc family DNA-binding protein [Azospirillum oleiclasticum]